MKIHAHCNVDAIRLSTAKHSPEFASFIHADVFRVFGEEVGKHFNTREVNATVYQWRDNRHTRTFGVALNVFSDGQLRDYVDAEVSRRGYLSTTLADTLERENLKLRTKMEAAVAVLES